jgi:hypothetical protein
MLNRPRNKPERLEAKLRSVRDGLTRAGADGALVVVCAAAHREIVRQSRN